MNRNLLSLPVAISGLLWLATSAGSAADAPRPVEVKTATPARGDIHRYVTLPGSLKANQQATLYAKVPGYLKTLSVDRGDTVKAGQALGEIEVPELAADLARCKAELVRAEAEVKVAEIEARRLAKARESAPDLVLPQAVDNAEGRLAVARATVGTAKANLERTEKLLDYSRLTAPFSGIVTARFVDPGAFIPAATSGSAAQTAAVVTLMDFSTVRAQVAVPEAEAALVRTGQPVQLAVEGLRGRTFIAKVSRFSYALDDVTRTMLVEADLPNPSLELRPGMYATLKLGVEQHTGALLIPAEAVVMEKANTSAFIVEAGRAKKVPLKLGFNDGAKAEVLSGLSGSEQVILIGKQSLTNGQAVNAVEVK